LDELLPDRELLLLCQGLDREEGAPASHEGAELKGFWLKRVE
jgi:hypothetical protein